MKLEQQLNLHFVPIFRTKFCTYSLHIPITAIYGQNNNCHFALLQFYDNCIWI